MTGNEGVDREHACGERVKPVTARGSGCYVCESVREPSGQVLTKIWALKAWLNQPITRQVQVQLIKYLCSGSPVVNRYFGITGPGPPR